MLSKFSPWDFSARYPITIDSKKPGIYAFLVTDPFLERIFSEKLPRQEIPFLLYSGNEVSRDFIEEQFINLSFFTSQEQIHVINGELIPSDSLDLLLESGIEWSERFLVIFFSKKSKAVTEFLKHKDVNGFEIEEPKFWEGAKLWQFLQKSHNVNFTGDVSHLVLENLEHNSESFSWAINLIKINFPNGKVDVNQLKELITKEKWDIFEFINIFQSSPKRFFVEVLKNTNADFEWYRSTFAFMQGYLTKVLSPEELQEKAKPNKYEQGILDYSKRAKRDELVSYLRIFSDLEIKAKSQDELLRNELRLLSL